MWKHVADSASPFQVALAVRAGWRAGLTNSGPVHGPPHPRDGRRSEFGELGRGSRPVNFCFRGKCRCREERTSNPEDCPTRPHPHLRVFRLRPPPPPCLPGYRSPRRRDAARPLSQQPALQYLPRRRRRRRRPSFPSSPPSPSRPEAHPSSPACPTTGAPTTSASARVAVPRPAMARPRVVV